MRFREVSTRNASSMHPTRPEFPDRRFALRLRLALAISLALLLGAQSLAQTGAVEIRLDPAAKKPARKPSPPLASLPAPKASGPLRILLVDDDINYDITPGGARLSASDKIFRDLVAAAVGGDANAWSVEMVEIYKHGPAFERLRDFNVVIWYTGGSYGGNANGVDTLSVEDEKTVRRYLQEVGGAFVLVSPGFLSTRSYSMTWTESANPFLKEVMGVNGFSDLVQRFAAGTVRAADGTSFGVEAKGAVEPQFSAVNPDGAAVVFSAALDPKKTAEGAVPVAVAHPFGGGRFVYVGFTLENIPKPDLTQAFARLLEACGASIPRTMSASPVAGIQPPPATTLRVPPPASASPGAATAQSTAGAGVTDAPQAFAVTGSGRDSFNFYASQTGPIRAQVQSRGVPVVVTLFHPDGRKVDHTGTAGFACEDVVSAADLAKGHVWGIGIRAATATTEPGIVASGSIVVSHPASDRASVQAQLDTLPSRTQVLKAAAPIQVVPLTAENRGVLKATLIGTTTTPPSPMVNATMTIVSPVVMGQAVPLPPREPVPKVNYSILAGGPGATIVVFGKDLFPPGTSAGRIYLDRSAPSYNAELHFTTPDGQELTVTAGAVEDFYNGRVGSETETDPQVSWDGRPLSTRYQRYYVVSVPHVIAQQDTTLTMYFKTKDDRVSAPVNFTYKPPMRDEVMSLPIAANGQLYDSTISSVYPNISLTQNIKRDSFLLGFTGHDTFYNSYQLRNGWKVVSATVKLGYTVGGGAEVVESRVGTPSPYVKVRWYLEPTFLFSSDLSYSIKIHVRGPSEFEPFW
jgi:hypothetical protein